MISGVKSVEPPSQEIVISQFVLTFYDVYGSECLNFVHFPPSQPEMQMEHAFKAKRVTFREGNYEKVEKLISMCS